MNKHIFKKHIFKTILIFAAVILCLTAFTSQTSAAETGTCGDNIYWELNDWGNLYIYGSGDMPDFSPDEPAPWAAYLPEGQLTVTIESNVTSVGAYAFYGYTGALFVHMENSAVMSIGEYAFYNCENLFEIYFPESIMTIGDYAFYYCANLQEISRLDLLISIGNYAFNGCFSLHTLPFGSSLNTIGEFAFADCYNLQAMTVPASVTSIEAYAFSCAGLQTVTFEGNAPMIHPDAFSSLSMDAYYDPNTDGWEEILSQTFYADIRWYAMGSSGSSILGTGTCGDNLQWVLTDDGVLTVSGTGRMTDYLAMDTPWENLNEQITSVVIENGVEYIGREAFQDCINLTEITVADSVICIGAYAFDNTGWLENQPNGLVYLGKVVYAYKGTCPASVTLAEDTIGIAAMAFQNVQTLKSIHFPSGIREVGSWAFHNCVALKQVDLNNGLTTIGYSAFGGCDSLTLINIPDSVTFMDSGAFGSCSSVEKIVIGDGLMDIGYSVFSYCEALTDIEFGKNIRSIGISAFSGCTALEQVELPTTVHTIHDKAFQGCTALNAVTLPQVTKISYYAFSGCTALKDVEFPETLLSIGDGAFSYCTSLTGVTVPDSVTSLEQDCFKACTAMKKVCIGKGVTNINSQAFLNCTALTEISVDADNTLYMSDEFGVLHTKDQQTLLIYPIGRTGAYTVADTVTKIDRNAFSGCSGLTAITLPEGLVTLEYGVFLGCTALKEVTLPDSLVTTYGGTFSGCTALERVWLGKGLTNVSATMFKDCTALKEVHLPVALTSIWGSAFENCASLTAVVLPNTLTEISYAAFSGCTALKDIVLPESLKIIDGMAFYECAAIQELYIPDSVESIGDSAFHSCSSLSTVILPKNLRLISDKAFYRCSALTSIVLPDTITKINANAFAGCSKLEAVKYTGSQEKWQSVTLGQNAIPAKVQIVYNYLRYGAVDTYGVTLKDNIGITFVMKLSDEILSDSGAYITVTYDGATRIIPVANATGGISLDLAAAQMTVPIQLAISFRHGSTGDTMTYTVKQYAQSILSGNYDDDIKHLAAAMLNYGGKAQKYFNYKMDALADAGISINELTIPGLNGTQLTAAGNLDGLQLYGASLVFRNKLAVRYYFTADTFPKDLQFTVGDAVLNPVEKNGLYYVEVADIAPQDLNTAVDLQVTDGIHVMTVSYSPMDYITRMHQNGNESLKALLQALYTYHIAAKNYTAA